MIESYLVIDDFYRVSVEFIEAKSARQIYRFWEILAISAISCSHSRYCMDF